MSKAEHGPWIESNVHEGETYCKKCLTRSIFAAYRSCDPPLVQKPKPRQPLTDEQINTIIEKLDPIFLDVPANFLTEFTRAVEQAHEIGIKP